MLGVLGEANDLTNLCVVVTSYFGGIVRTGCFYAGSVALVIKEIDLVEIKRTAGLRSKTVLQPISDFANFLKTENLAEYDTEFLQILFHFFFLLTKVKESCSKDKLTGVFIGQIGDDRSGLRQVEVPLDT